MIDKTKKHRCRSCWWQEGGRCYNEKIAQITKIPSGQKGELITDKTECRCIENLGYKNKRTMLTQVIPNDKLVILSDEKIGTLLRKQNEH